MVFSAFPRSGPPPRFRDYADYAEVIGRSSAPAASPTTRTSGGTSAPPRGSARSSCGSATPSPRCSTMRSRSRPTYQALVKHYSRGFESGREARRPITAPLRLRTSSSPAATGSRRRSWTSPPGKRNRIPMAKLIRRTLKELEPHARELGAERELEGIRNILARGNGSDPQQSSGPSTRTATSSRSSPRSPPRPRSPLGSPAIFVPFGAFFFF